MKKKDENKPVEDEANVHEASDFDDDDEFDEVAYVRGETKAKRFETEAAAKEFAKWLNPNCEVVPLAEGDDHD